MSYIFNNNTQKGKRRRLRSNLPGPEIILWLKLKGRLLGGYKFSRQQSVGPYVVDFYCPEHRLAIEINGDSHFVDPDKTYNKDRQKFIELFGVKFIRFTNTDITKKSS